MNITRDISSTFMIANLIAMLLIVAIHYNSKGSIDISLGYDINYFFQETVTNGFARSAVPIFALLSGFFLINKVATFNEYRLTLINKFHTLFVPYLMASLIIYFFSFIHDLYFGKAPSQQIDLYSTAYRVLTHPPTVQFWFLRDLMILVFISPLLFNAKRLLFYSIGLLLFILWGMDIQPFRIVAGWYFLNIETLFFFWLGGMLSRCKINLDKIIFCRNTTKIIVMAFWAGIVILRVYTDPDLDVWYVNNYTLESILLYKLGIIVGIVNLLQISAAIRNNRFFIYASGLTFFVFLFHFSPLSYFRYFTEKAIESPYSFYLNFPVAVLLVFVIAYIASKYFERFYILINGGRSPNKALQRTV